MPGELRVGGKETRVVTGEEGAKLCRPLQGYIVLNFECNGKLSSLKKKKET